MQFNDLYCLARPEVHTLELRRGPAGGFRRARRARWSYYDSIAETIAPIEKRLRAEMDGVLGADWCARWSEGLAATTCDVPGQINVLGNPAPLDLRQVARPRRLGQDALQPAGPGRSLVSRPERREGCGS